MHPQAREKWQANGQKDIAFKARTHGANDAQPIGNNRDHEEKGESEDHVSIPDNVEGRACNDERDSERPFGADGRWRGDVLTGKRGGVYEEIVNGANSSPITPLSYYDRQEPDVSKSLKTA